MFYGPLSAAAAMLQASGPSRTPVGLGQVAGAGMQGMMGGMQMDAAAQRQQQTQSNLGKIADKFNDPAAVKAAWQQGAAPLLADAGIPHRYFAQLAHDESGNRNIRQGVNSTGSAFGPFQFTAGTWNDVAAKNPQLGLRPEDRFNPIAQGKAIVAFTAANQQQLQGELGRAPTLAELKLAHRFGADGALALLRNPTKTVGQVLPAAAAANPQWSNLRVNAVLQDSGVPADDAAAAGNSSSLSVAKGAGGVTAQDIIGLLANQQTGEPKQIGSNLDNLTPQTREIFSIALRDPTLGPGALNALLQIGASGSGKGEGGASPTEVAKLLLQLQGQQQSSAESAQRLGLEQRRSDMEQRRLNLTEQQANTTPVQKDAEALGLRPGTPEYDSYVRQRTLQGSPEAVAATAAAMASKMQAAPANTAASKMFQSAIEGGASARSHLANLDAVEMALKDLPTGAGASRIADIGAFLHSYGLDPKTFGLPDSASAAQVSGALLKPLILELRNPAGGAGMPGSLSDSDRKFLESSTASIENTPGANAGIIMLQRRMQQRNLDIENLAIQHEEANGGNVTPTFLREVRDWSAAHPLFDDDFRKQYDAAIKQPTPSVLGGQSAQPAAVPSIADLSKMSPADLNALPADVKAAINADPKAISVLHQRFGAPK